MKNTGNLIVTTPNDREIVMTRVFDAPRSLVFDAMSKPELLGRWLLGPPGWSMTVCENDLKVGGVFRHVWSGPDGKEMSMRGVYREVVPPERVVRTESFDFGCDAQSGEQLGTLVLTEREGKTTLTLTLLYPSKEARDATIASGMEHGAGASYDRLAELLTSVASDVGAPRAQPLICVRDVEASSRWYQRLLGCQSAHGGPEYERLVSRGRLILQLHRWDVDHDHGPIGDPNLKPYGNGVLLWFELDDFESAFARAEEMKAEVIKPRWRNPGPNHRECWLRDPEGYSVVLAGPDGSAG